MLNILFTWWKHQMRDLIPASVWNYRRAWRKTLVVAVDSLQASTVTLHVRGHGRTKLLGWHHLGDPTLQKARSTVRLVRTSNTALSIPQDAALERIITLPAVAEQGLSQLLKYEMDRFSPLAADELFWTARVQARDTIRNRLRVQLTMVPRLHLQAILQALSEAGLSPTCIEVGASTADSRIIPLTSTKSKSCWMGPRSGAIMFGACGILVVVAITLPFVLQSLAHSRLEAEIEVLRPQVSRAEALRKKLATNTTLNEVVTSSRRQAHTPLQVIATLTELIPDDTHLTSISLRQNKVNISGRSAAAARLIAILAAHPFVHNPTFTAPVIHDETSDRDLFQIYLNMDD